MFKKLLVLLTLFVTFIQPVYADGIIDKATETLNLIVKEYKQGNKERFLVAEKEAKKIIEESDDREDINLLLYFLSEIYMGTEQYKKARPHLEALIENLKKDGAKDTDLTFLYIKLAGALWDSGNITKAKHYAGLACDNGEQDGCKLYRLLNESNSRN